MLYKWVYRLLILTAMLQMSVSAEAQERPVGNYSFEFRGELLEHALDKIARETETDLVYDPDLVRGAEVFARIMNETVEGALRAVLADHGLDYLTLSSGTIVIVKMRSEDPAFGIFSGTVLDQRTGEPLPGATVMLADAAGGTSTGRSGNFSLPRLMSGEHTIIFSYVGYKPVSKSVRIPPNEQVRETIHLQPEPVSVAPVIVESHRPQFFGGYPGLSPGEEGATSAISEYRNPVRDLSLMPGVQHGLPMNGIRIQGGQQSENQLLLDGVPVYNPYSVGKMFSAFSPQAIGGVTMHRAGFGAANGSRISGATDLFHELPADGQKGAKLQADPLSVNLKGDLSFQLDDESSFSIMSAVRTNYWDLYRDPVLEQTLRNWDRIDPLIINQTAGLEDDASFYLPMDHKSELEFYDLHTATRYRFNPYNEISASVYVSGNELGTAVLNRAIPEADAEPYLLASERYSWKNRVGQISWNSLLTPRTDLNTKVSYSYGSFGHSSEIGTRQTPVFPGSVFSAASERVAADTELSIELPTTIEGNRIKHFIAASGMTYSFSSALKLESGLQYEHVRSEVDVEESSYLPTFANVRSNMLSSYLTMDYRFGEYWHVSAGSRLTFLNENSTVYAEPRASIQYDRLDSGIGYWSAKLSGGLYRQFINEYSITNTGASAVVPSFSVWSHAGTAEIPKAYHLAGSWYAAFNDVSTLRLELFYKWQPATNITSYRNLISGDDLDRSEVGAFAESTEMVAAGGSVRMDRSFADDRFSLMAGYDYSFTRLNMESQFGKTVPAPWSEPHRTQLRAIWNLNSDITFAGKWHGIWGRMWAFRESYYNYLQIADPVRAAQFQFNNPEEDKLGAFSQADVSLIYRPSAGAADLELRLDFINIFNRKNPLDIQLLPILDAGEIRGYRSFERTMPGFYPSVSLQVEF